MNKSTNGSSGEGLRHDYYYQEPPLAKLAYLLLPEETLPTEAESEIPVGLPVSSDTVAAGAGEASAEDQLRQILADRAFNFAVVPAKPHPVLTLGGRVISTPGNLTNIQGPVKSGKSGTLEAILASVFNGNRIGPDTLGFAAENVCARAVLHFDTEQSRYDHDSLIRRALRRARVDAPPPWFSSFNLTDLPVGQRKGAIELAVKDAADAHGGVFMIVIDGVADICASTNDEVEANALVARLHAMAIEHDCAIITVLHENPGSVEGKMRGHLGSQLERKAETPLRLSKDPNTGVTTVWADRARHCHLPKSEGVCFAWSDQLRMHVSAGSAKEIKAGARLSKFANEAESAFGEAESMSYAALVSAIMTSLDVVQKTAEKRVKSYAADGIIVKTVSGYALKS